jgi:hypothetical protein
MLLLAADLQKFDLYHLQQLCKKDSLNSGLKSFKNYIEQKKILDSSNNSQNLVSK